VKKSDSKLRWQSVKERHPEVSEKMKPSAELYYIKMAEGFIFLDIPRVW
jgi:hypothetical protein